MSQLEKEVEVRNLQPGEEEKIVELLKLVFDGWPKFDLLCSPLEHWRWKYQANPLKMSQITLGVSGSTIIGCNHSLFSRIKIGNRTFLSSQGGDAAVRPEFMGRTIFRKMMDLKMKKGKESGAQMHYFLTWNPILRKSLPKFFHKFPHVVMNLFRIHDVDLHLRKRPIRYGFINKCGFYLLKLASRCRNTLRVYHSFPREFHIGEITHFDERIESFWEEIKDHYNFIVERSGDYLNWRYCDPRGGDYLVKIAQMDGKILGYMVLRINSHQIDYPIGYIVDLLTLPNRFDVASALVEEAVSYFDDHQINIIHSLIVKSHPYGAIFDKKGFIIKRERIPLFYRGYSEVEEFKQLESSPPSRIHFAYGDLDVI
ncbi:MAG: GNAT family N-acetyltransferase [Syntrophaceae bacterium]|nr:GNAT family N-acetyltransferase [Syntrophaceae bacterium]